MQHSDIERVVNIHLQSFPGFFLSFLGPRFLTLYYQRVCISPEGICQVFLDSTGNPSGFVVGTCNPRGFYSRLLRCDWLRFCLASLGTICRSPKIIVRLARALHHPRGNPMGEGIAGLFSIGVLPELQGTGAGKKLVAAFLTEARQRGCRRVFLTTDRDNNEAVNRFYASLGFQIERQYETPEGRRMNEFWISV